jgi:hypothetical protein
MKGFLQNKTILWLDDDMKGSDELILSIYGKSQEILWTRLGLLIFAIVFLLLGSLRVSEFSGIGLRKRTQVLLAVIHVFGTLLFSMALGLLALDIERVLQNVISVCFVLGVFILFPLHIYAAVRRRLHVKQSEK